MTELIASSVYADDPPDHVLELTAANFSSVVDAAGARVLVQFYLPWCSICKRLAEPYKAAAGRIHKTARGRSTAAAARRTTCTTSCCGAAGRW